MVQTDVLQCSFPSGSDFDPCYLLEKKFGPQKIKVILDILILCGCGVVIQLLYSPLLMTGFGMSLGILALFLTINNPNANQDSLTGVYNHLYLTRRSDELIAAGKSFHIITIYLYQLKHINKVAGVEGGDHILQLTAKNWKNCVEAGFSVLRENVF